MRPRSATLVIQIFEFIRRSSPPFSPYFSLSLSFGLPRLYLTFRPRSCRPRSFSSSRLPPCLPLFSNSSRLPAGQHTGEPLAISGYRCLPGKCVYVRVSLFLPHSRCLPRPPSHCPLARSSRFGNNKYALLRAASNARVTTWSRNFLLESNR